MEGRITLLYQNVNKLSTIFSSIVTFERFSKLSKTERFKIPFKAQTEKPKKSCKI